MTPTELNLWFAAEQQQEIVARLINRLGVTRTRAQCFVRLWVYLLVKQYQQKLPQLKPPLGELELLVAPMSCTHREAAELFYGDRETGSDRAAGIMLDKLAALKLIQKSFDGNRTQIEINPMLELQAVLPEPHVELKIDAFDPRCDAIQVANLLATSYNWMNRNTDAAPQRIARLLRFWASEYPVGMRVLRRCDNLHPVGFYLLYPVARESEFNFFNPPSKSLHLSALTETDPFTMASPGDQTCTALFIRSWIIDDPFIKYHIPFMEDVKQVLVQIRQDFPNLCDLYSLLIHPEYEKLANGLGFQRMTKDSQLSICWLYLALDRFLALDIKTALGHL